MTPAALGVVVACGFVAVALAIAGCSLAVVGWLRLALLIGDEVKAYGGSEAAGFVAYLICTFLPVAIGLGVAAWVAA